MLAPATTTTTTNKEVRMNKANTRHFALEMHENWNRKKRSVDLLLRLELEQRFDETMQLLVYGKCHHKSALQTKPNQTKPTETKRE